MPTYQYQCTACQEGLEVVQKFTDDALTECPGCQGRLKKVYSAVGIVFKGSGFYRNDSRSTSSSSSPASPGKTADKDTGKSGAKDGAKSTPAASTTSAGSSSAGSSSAPAA